MGPWTVTRSSLRMLRRVAASCRPLRPVLLLVSFPRSRRPVVGVLGLCWMWHAVPFVRQRRPVVGVLGLLRGSFDCCCPHTSVLRPSTTCLAAFSCALFLRRRLLPLTGPPFLSTGRLMGPSGGPPGAGSPGRRRTTALCPLPPLCDIPSGCCSFTGPWTVTRSSLRMLRRVATFCRPLRPVLLLVSFPRSRSPVVGVLGLC